MANNVPPVPYRAQLTDANGILTPAWAQWFRQLFVRVGGFTALTNSELAPQTTVTTLQTTVSSIQSISLQSLEAEIKDLNQGPTL